MSKCQKVYSFQTCVLLCAWVCALATFTKESDDARTTQTIASTIILSMFYVHGAILSGRRAAAEVLLASLLLEIIYVKIYDLISRVINYLAFLKRQ